MTETPKKERQRLSLEDLVSLDGVEILPDVLPILQSLESVGFKFNSMCSNGSAFECIRSETYNGEMIFPRES